MVWVATLAYSSRLGVYIYESMDSWGKIYKISYIIMENAHLAFEEFPTPLSQIKTILNSRPITPFSPDPHLMCNEETGIGCVY